jgi:putative cell wall-binding protein
MPSISPRVRVLAALACAGVVSGGLGVAGSPANAAPGEPSSFAAARAAEKAETRQALAARSAASPGAFPGAQDAAATLPANYAQYPLVWPNNSGEGSLVVLRGPGVDPVVLRGGAWSAVPGSGNGELEDGDGGPTSTVWKTGDRVYRYDLGTGARISQPAPADSMFLANTGDGWLLGVGVRGGAAGGSLVHLATDGTTKSTTPIGPGLILGGYAVEGTGVVFNRFTSDGTTDEIVYLDLATATLSTVFTSPADRFIGSDVSLTPTNIGFYTVGQTSGTVYRRSRTTTDTATWSLPVTVDQAAASDNGFAWTYTDSKGKLAGLRSVATGATGSVAATLPARTGFLVARTTDFAITSELGTPAAGVRRLVPGAKATTALPALPTATSADVRRFTGVDRYAASAATSRLTFAPDVAKVYIASGSDYSVSLAAAAVAAKNGSPVLLVPGTSIPAAVKTELTRLKPRSITVVGGSGAVSADVQKQLKAYTAGGVTRASGADRYAAAAALSKANYAAGVAKAYIATGTSYGDALTAAAVAGKNGAPVLLVPGTSLPAAVKAELTRLKPAGIVVVGTTKSVSAEVATQLKSYTAGGVTRVSTADRYAASAALSRSAFAAGTSTVYIVTTGNFTDALTAAPAAGKAGAPILLVSASVIPAAVRAELTRLDPDRVVIVGATGAVSNNVRAALGRFLNPRPDFVPVS